MARDKLKAEVESGSVVAVEDNHNAQFFFHKLMTLLDIHEHIISKEQSHEHIVNEENDRPRVRETDDEENYKPPQFGSMRAQSRQKYATKQKKKIIKP